MFPDPTLLPFIIQVTLGEPVAVSVKVCTCEGTIATELGETETEFAKFSIATTRPPRRMYSLLNVWANKPANTPNRQTPLMA